MNMKKDKQKAEETPKMAKPSLRSLIPDEFFNSLSPEGQERIMKGQAMEGWSEEGDAWLHADVMGEGGGE